MRLYLSSFRRSYLGARRKRFCATSRFLKPGGYALVTVCSADDEWEKELIANHPGLEPNSTLWPQNGKFQKDYDETELREFYDAFETVELKKISKSAFKLGREGTATNLWMVLRKPTA